MSNGPTDDEAEIIQHDQLAQQSEEEPEVKTGLSVSVTTLSFIMTRLNMLTELEEVLKSY